MQHTSGISTFQSMYLLNLMMVGQITTEINGEQHQSFRMGYVIFDSPEQGIVTLF